MFQTTNQLYIIMVMIVAFSCCQMGLTQESVPQNETNESGRHNLCFLLRIWSNSFSLDDSLSHVT